MTADPVSLSYSPRDVFKPLHARTKRWAIVISHRRAGKTVASVLDLILRAAGAAGDVAENARYAYLAPFRTQAKSVTWDYLKFYSRPILANPPNESELRCDLLNGARISLYGADNPDALRGLGLDGIVIDEVAEVAPSVWSQIIRPALSDRHGWGLIIGTPRGRGRLFEIWEQAVRDPAWFSLMLKASDTGLLSPAELEDARRIMTPEEFAQEYECSFNAAIIGAYYGKELADAETECRIGKVALDDRLPVQTAWDLGFGDSTAIWAFQIMANEVRVIGYYENHHQPLSHYAATHAENQCNKPHFAASSLKGAYYSHHRRKWFSSIKKNRKNIYLGAYSTKEAACLAYCAAAKEFHGQFARVEVDFERAVMDYLIQNGGWNAQDCRYHQEA